MIVKYTHRAKADISRIAARSHIEFGATVALDLEQSIRAVGRMLADNPFSGMSVRQRAGVRKVPLSRYPFAVIYRVLANEVRILHVRHTSREPW
ncbi:MAG: type II toxin-antitoxin system RelE/ParE family toxin [Bauldia sp.]|nr:type II toxin-antitoxin system RelE/ParE family toxin [Bauldia sp.]